MEQLLARGQREEAANAGEALLSVAEVESIVRTLRAFPLEEVGTPAWFAQHDRLQQLNVQAHHNAQTRSEEYVKEALVSLGQLGLLVEELLAAEAWRDRLLPLLRHRLAHTLDSVASYQLVCHESALANLMEVVLFHPDACEAMGEDAVLELADWCARRIAYLAADGICHAQFTERTAQELLARTAEDELLEAEQETAFGAANSALTLLRYLSEHATSPASRISIGALNRIASSNDAVFALLPLLERPPWLRRGRGGREECYVGGQWQAVDPADRLRLTQQEAQVWLTLNHLLVDPVARSKLDLTAARCETLFQLKSRFSEVLFDQLPVLRDLQRVIDELLLGVNNAPLELAPSKLIIEAVPQLRARLLARTDADWRSLADDAKSRQFGHAAAALSRQRLEGMLRSLEFMCGMEGRGGGMAQKQRPSCVKVDAYRRVKEGVWEWWATYSLDINTDCAAELIHTSAAGGAPSKAPGTAGRASNENRPKQQTATDSNAGPQVQQQTGDKVSGLRYRLRPLSEGLQRALPADGKVAVLYGGHSCEALLHLPSSETRDVSGLAPAVWLTVGSLAGGGLVLQLKLKRLERPSERDKASGAWHAYVPLGGGLTVREDLAD